jgi:hypothetical protein
VIRTCLAGASILPSPSTLGSLLADPSASLPTEVSYSSPLLELTLLPPTLLPEAPYIDWSSLVSSPLPTITSSRPKEKISLFLFGSHFSSNKNSPSSPTRPIVAPWSEFVFSAIKILSFLEGRPREPKLIFFFSGKRFFLWRFEDKVFS